MRRRVVLIASWTNIRGKKYPVGQIIQGDKELTEELINSGKAKRYEGRYPPREKVKSDFFKPKK